MSLRAFLAALLVLGLTLAGCSDAPNDDRDDDGLTDDEEAAFGSSPTDADSDNDGLKDGQERATGTDPRDGDSDDDGVRDLDEVLQGRDPMVSNLATFNEPVSMQGGLLPGEDGDGGEPSLAIGPDGVIWVTAPAGLGGGDRVWRSTDDGATFEYVATPDPVFGGGDSDIAVGSTGLLWQTGLWLGCVSAATSMDGTLWAMNPVVCGIPVDDRNWIEAVGPSTAYLAFGSGQAATRQMVLARLDAPGGGAPALTSTIALPDSADYQWPANHAILPDGTILVGYLTDTDIVSVYRVTDSGLPGVGLTAEKVQVSARSNDTFDSFAVVVGDNAGNAYITWSERTGDEGDRVNRTDIWMAASPDGGVTWNEPVLVNKAPATTVFPWLAAGDAGHVGIVYYGTNVSAASPEDADGEWQVYYAVTSDALAPTPHFDESAATGTMHDGVICTSGTGCAGNTRALGDFFEVADGADGRVHIAYTDSTGPTPRIWYVGQSGGPLLTGADVMDDETGEA